MQTSKLYCSDVFRVEQIGEGIVDLIESGKLNSPEMTKLLQKYLKPMLKANIDYLVLGCTHYPYLIPQLKKMLPKTVKIIDSGKAVAKQTSVVLNSHGLLSENNDNTFHKFYTNGQLEILKSVLPHEKRIDSLLF